MSWSNILNILNGKTVAPIIVSKKKVVWPEKWQLVPVLDIMSMLDCKSALNIKLLRQGCEIPQNSLCGRRNSLLQQVCH